MKKFIFILPLVVLLAAGCSKVNQPSTQPDAVKKPITVSKSKTTTSPSKPVASAPKNCGKVIDEHFSDLFFGDASKLNAEDKTAAKCMTAALLSCSTATHSDYSLERKETVNSKIVGKESTNCKVYLESFSGGYAPKTCKIPMDVISDAYEKAKQDGLQDYTYHMLIPALFLSSISISGNGISGSGSYTHPKTGQKMTLDCQ